MNKNNFRYRRHEDDSETNRRPHKVQKGNRIDKHRKRIYTMVESLDLDDEAFDEYLDDEYENAQRNKYR